MRHFCLTLFLLLSYVFLGYTGADGSPDLKSLVEADASSEGTPPPESGTPTAVDNPPPTAKKDAVEEATPEGAPSLAAEKQADGQTPAEMQAQQQQKDAIEKINSAQAQKEQADKDKAAAEAELSAAKTSEEKEAAEAKIKRAKKEEKEAKRAQEEAQKAEKDAAKASEKARKAGEKLRSAKVKEEAAISAEKEAQTKADQADAELEEAKKTGDAQKIKTAEQEAKTAHKTLLKAKTDTNKAKTTETKLKEETETAQSKVTDATKALSEADEEHTKAQNAVFADQEALAKAQAGGDASKIKEAQGKLASDEAIEKTTSKKLKEARTQSETAKKALNKQLMKTETPEETRDRLAAEANSNLSAAQISQRSAQDALTTAQAQLDQARENNEPANVQEILGKNVDAAQAQLDQANTNLTTATQSADETNADADSPLGLAQNSIQQLEAQQEDLESQKQDASSAAEAAGSVINLASEGSPEKQAAKEAKEEADAQVAELQKKIEAGNAALEQAKAKLALAHQNEENYKKALGERRLAKRKQKETAKEEAAAQKNFDTLKTKGATREQLAAAEKRLNAALDKNSKAKKELKEKEEEFQKRQGLAQTPLQRLRLKVTQNQAKIAELELSKAKIYQDLRQKKEKLDEKVKEGTSDEGDLRSEVARLEFRYDDENEKIKVLQKSINQDEAKINEADQAVNADALPGVIDLEKRFLGKRKDVDDSLAKETTGTGVVTPEEEIEKEEADALSPEALDGSEGNAEVDPLSPQALDESEESAGIDPLAPDVGTEDERGPQIPIFQNRFSQPVFGPGGGSVANFTSPGGTTPNFNKAAGTVATFAAGSGAVPAFNTSAGDVSFGNAATPLPWSASSPKIPNFGAAQAKPFGESAAPMPVFGAGSQKSFGGASAPSTAAIPLTVTGDGLTKIKSATHLAELAPPTVSEEKKQALMRAKEVLTSAAESLKAAEKTENLGTITKAQITRDVAELKYQQALNNASPLGVPETESSGWWNTDPSSPYSGYNVDGGGRMNAPVQTSERTEHFVLSDLEALQPISEETLPDGSKVLAVENVGFAMKRGKIIPAIVKLARAGAAAAA